MKPELPADLHALATSPAWPAVPAVVPTGRDELTKKLNIQLFHPIGGHTILDLYFCAIMPAVAGSMVNLPHELANVPDVELDELSGLAWRLAISAVRTRPNTGPVPAGIPKEGL